MAFKNPEGLHVSSESAELIKELKIDIAEFGENEEVSVWCKKKYGVTLYTNYDFLTPEEVGDDELVDGEYIKSMSLGELLHLLEQQDSVL